MVLKVFANTRRVVQNWNAHLDQVLGWPDSAEHKQLRRINCARREDYLPFRANLMLRALPVEFNSNCAFIRIK